MSSARKQKAKQGRKLPKRRKSSPRRAGGDFAKILDQACQLHRMGELQLAAELYESVLVIAPQNADALHLLGVIEHQQGRHADALDKLGRSLAISPSSTAYSNLSTVFQALGRHRESLAAAEHAVWLDPDFVDGLMNLGKCQSALGLHDQAERSFRKVLQLAPRHIEAAGQLAYLLETGNQDHEAERLAASLIEADPHNVLLNLVLAKCERRRGEWAEASARLTRLLENNREADSNRFVHFELGMLLDRQEQSATAFKHFERANELARARSPFGGYEANPQIREIRALAQACTPEWFPSWSSLEETSRQPPVFVFGFPRSGTTLLDQMLDSHPALETHQEVPALWKVIAELEATAEGYPGRLANLTAEERENLRNIYYETHRARGTVGANTRLVDTNPLGTIHIPLIIRLFPDAPTIMELRHPADVCLSCFMQDFRLNAAMANFTSLSDTVSMYCEVMELWQSYRKYIPFSQHIVHYEQLVEDPEAGLRGICDYLSLDWDPAMLEFSSHARRRGRINTPSYHQVTEGIYARAAFRFEKYLEQLSPVVPRLAPFIKDFGYPALPDPAE